MRERVNSCRERADLEQQPQVLQFLMEGLEPLSHTSKFPPEQFRPQDFPQPKENNIYNLLLRDCETRKKQLYPNTPHIPILDM
jgi:hypothetical protein